MAMVSKRKRRSVLVAILTPGLAAVTEPAAAATGTGRGVERHQPRPLCQGQKSKA